MRSHNNSNFHELKFKVFNEINRIFSQDRISLNSLQISLQILLQIYCRFYYVYHLWISLHISLQISLHFYGFYCKSFMDFTEYFKEIQDTDFTKIRFHYGILLQISCYIQFYWNQNYFMRFQQDFIKATEFHRISWLHFINLTTATGFYKERSTRFHKIHRSLQDYIKSRRISWNL